MSQLQAPRKLSKRQQMREDTLTTFTDRALVLFEKNRTLLIGIGVGIVALVLLGFAYNYYQGQQAIEASERLGAILNVYENGSYEQALEGTTDRIGLIEIADQYGGTPDGNLATFYAADALFQLGRKDEALDYFRSYDKGRDYIGASALAGEAAVYEDRGDYADAAERYEDAARLYPNELYSPGYLLDAARNYELAGDFGDARDAYERIQEEYPETPEAGGVSLRLAQLDAMAQ
ncbi:MAG: tetratricopeptide repeat protein [Bacteroidota bacterium]